MPQPTMIHEAGEWEYVGALQEVPAESALTPGRVYAVRLGYVWATWQVGSDSSAWGAAKQAMAWPQAVGDITILGGVLTSYSRMTTAHPLHPYGIEAWWRFRVNTAMTMGEAVEAIIRYLDEGNTDPADPLAYWPDVLSMDVEYAGGPQGSSGWLIAAAAGVGLIAGYMARGKK